MVQYNDSCFLMSKNALILRFIHILVVVIVENTSQLYDVPSHKMYVTSLEYLQHYGLMFLCLLLTA